MFYLDVLESFSVWFFVIWKGKNHLGFFYWRFISLKENVEYEVLKAVQAIIV